MVSHGIGLEALKATQDGLILFDIFFQSSIDTLVADQIQSGRRRLSSWLPLERCESKQLRLLRPRVRTASSVYGRLPRGGVQVLPLIFRVHGSLRFWPTP